MIPMKIKLNNHNNNQLPTTKMMSSKPPKQPESTFAAALQATAQAPHAFHDNINTYHGSGRELRGMYEAWWSVARRSSEPPSPVDFLLNFGYQRRLVKQVLRELLAVNCPNDDDNEQDISYYVGPGSLDYFSRPLRKMEDPFYHDDDEKDNASEEVQQDTLLEEAILLPHFHSKDLPTEMDLLSLADVTNPSDWSSVLEKAVCSRRYSSDFLRRLFAKLPASGWPSLSLNFLFDDHLPVKGSRYRTAVDADCIAALQQAMPKLEALQLRGQQYTIRGFVKCLGLLMKPYPALKALALVVPSLAWKDPPDRHNRSESYFEDDDGQLTLQIPNYHNNNDNQQQQQSSSIEQVRLDFLETKKMTYIDDELLESETMELKESSLVEMTMRVLSHMPNLRRLVLHLETVSLDTAAPYLVSFLQQQRTSLQELVIEYKPLEQRPVMNRSRAALLDIITSLQINNTLTHFCYVDSKYGQDHDDTTLFEDKLVEVLQYHNTTLQEVQLNDNIFNGEPSSNDTKKTIGVDFVTTCCRSKIEYYLELNKMGREVVATEFKDHAVEFIASMCYAGMQYYGASQNDVMEHQNDNPTITGNSSGAFCGAGGGGDGMWTQ